MTQLEEYVLLTLTQRPLYGLEIAVALAEGSGGTRKIGFGSLYPTLHKLEKRGLVKATWGEASHDERSGPRRKYYALTRQGTRALRDAERIRTNMASWSPS